MLRITMSTSAAAAEQYYDSALQRGDYYTKEGGLWGGRGAEMLGLQGSTQRADFVALCRGQHPGTKETLTQRSKEDRRPGYDFCCAVPKSVSLYLALSDDKAVEAMIQDSFRETMDESRRASNAVCARTVLKKIEQRATWCTAASLIGKPGQ
jgi:conjugative relaxase-like TrwC/TraI family protein